MAEEEERRTNGSIFSVSFQAASFEKVRPIK